MFEKWSFICIKPGAGADTPLGSFCFLKIINLLLMPQAKFQENKTLGSRKEDFYGFYYIQQASKFISKSAKIQCFWLYNTTNSNMTEMYNNKILNPCNAIRSITNGYQETANADRA